MGKPAARVTDFHSCPMPNPNGSPHVGGPVIQGQANVLIGGLPAAVVGNLCVCAGPPDSIIKGSTTVMIGGQFAARQGDFTAHSGQIVGGLPTVMIGD